MSDPVTIHVGDVREGLAQIPAGSVQCCVTSPPYWGLRDYGVEGQIGLEATPEAFVVKMVEVFAAVRRVLRDDGTLWLNIGDCYAGSGKGGNPPDSPYQKQATNMGSTFLVGQTARDAALTNVSRRMHADAGLKPKDLCMIPWRVALALQADGWWLRSVIVWHKRSPMPESVTDRPTSSWEPIFLLAKQERYFYDAEAVKEKSETTVFRKSKPTDEYAHGLTPSDVVGRPVQRGGKSLAYAYPNGIPFRNQRNVWHLGPEPYSDAHFATFPSEIPRRAIKAGTSEKGACPACGAPWMRVVERTDEEDPTAKGSRFDAGKTSGRTGGDRAQAGARMLKKPVGWAPGCDCNAGEPVPCLVLDPFLGSGTTIAVARQLGRHGVGCELNPEYVELAKVRIGKAEKPHTFQDTREEDAPLFGTLREVSP